MNIGSIEMKLVSLFPRTHYASADGAWELTIRNEVAQKQFPENIPGKIDVRIIGVDDAALKVSQ